MENLNAIRKASPYSAAITREQFLFYEMKTTASLMMEGLSDEEISGRIVKENLYQYPTLRSLRDMSRACIRRLHFLHSETLVEVIAKGPSPVAKQVCLYAMMKQYRLVWDFMITVVGDKYGHQDSHFTQRDMDDFMEQLREQDDWVALWSESTVKKVKQILYRLLVDNGYLDDRKSTVLNPVLIEPVLEKEIRKNHDEIALPAFDCFY